jgi:hypothetical protein
VLVGVPLHLRYKDEFAVVDASNQVLTALDKSIKKKDVYTCAELESALSRYLGKPIGDGTGKQCCSILLSRLAVSFRTVLAKLEKQTSPW